MAKYKVKTGFITQKFDDKLTIFKGETSTLYSFNATASYIFQCLKRGWQKEKIIDALVSKYEVGKKTAEKDVENLLAQLLKKKIISISS